MDETFNVDPDEFQVRKKARIEEMRKPQGAFLAPELAGELMPSPSSLSDRTDGLGAN